MDRGPNSSSVGKKPNSEMTTLNVNVRLWHGGVFTDSRTYTGKSYLEIAEYDWFEYGDSCFHELLFDMPDHDYNGVLRFGFKDKSTGSFKIVKCDDTDYDFVTYAMQYVNDKKNLLNIYCEMEDVKLEKGMGDEDEEDSEFDLDEVVLEEEEEISDDGMEDKDFSDDDEEFMEARRHKQRDMNKWRESKKDKEKTGLLNMNENVREKEVEKQVEDGAEIHNATEDYVEKQVEDEVHNQIAADFICIDDEMDSDASYESLDEDGKKIKKTQVYSKNIAPQDLKLVLGLRFFDSNECQRVVRHWAIANGYNIKWTKSSRGKLTAVCVEGCKWRMYASKINGEPTCIIKTLSSKHTCVRVQFNRQANAKFIAAHFLPKLICNPNMAIKDMQTEMLLTYGCTVKPMVCYRGKWKALEQIRGTFDEHYSKLRSYISELMRNDREGHFEVKTYLDNNDKCVFERLYIGFSALRKGFLIGCRKCIGFDACFLKTVLGGALLAAVSKDCNNKMYPIAWAVVEKENESTWTWFFERLFQDLNIQDGAGWTFMSDKQKGLINGIRSIAPHGEHRHCARHIYANWKKKFPGPKFKEHFWQTVKATSKAEYDWCFNKLKMESASAAADFQDKGPAAFCKALIGSFTKTDTILNNVCETFNSYILRCRDKHLIGMLEDIRLSLMSRLYELSTALEKTMDNPDPLCPNIRKKLDRIHDMVRFCEVRPAVGGKFEVRYFEDSYVVDLNVKECTCRAWEWNGIPCCHGMSCIFYNREDPTSYVDKFYFKKNAMDCYKCGISPLRGFKSWPVVTEAPIFPPQYTRAPGRPKKLRKRCIDEVQNTKNSSKLSMRGLQMSCKNCGAFDHNRRTCKELTRADLPPTKKKVKETATKETGSTASAIATAIAKAKATASATVFKKHTPTSTVFKKHTPYSTVKHVMQRETRRARHTYHLLHGESGSIYVREPVSRNVENIFVLGSLLIQTYYKRLH